MPHSSFPDVIDVTLHTVYIWIVQLYWNTNAHRQHWLENHSISQALCYWKLMKKSFFEINSVPCLLWGCIWLIIRHNKTLNVLRWQQMYWTSLWMLGLPKELSVDSFDYRLLSLLGSLSSLTRLRNKFSEKLQTIAFLATFCFKWQVHFFLYMYSNLKFTTADNFHPGEWMREPTW